MHTNDKILNILRDRGEEGISSKDLAKKFNYALIGSVCKPINQLRAAGHNIISDRATGVYRLCEKDTGIQSEEKSTQDNPESQNESVGTDNSETPFDVKLPKKAGKRERVLEHLIRSGDNGATPAELSKWSGVHVKNICFHIHDLRNSGNKIKLNEGRYCIQASSKHPRLNRGTKNLPVPNDIADIELILGDKRLLKGIKKIQPADLPTYMDLLKKIIYYTNCALAMHNTIDMIESLTIGDDQ